MLEVFLSYPEPQQATMLTVLVGVVVWVVRKLFKLELAPGVLTNLVAVVLGVLSGWAANGWEGAVFGALAGLAATGGHQFYKQTVKVVKPVVEDSERMS